MLQDGDTGDHRGHSKHPSNRYGVECVQLRHADLTVSWPA